MIADEITVTPGAFEQAIRGAQLAHAAEAMSFVAGVLADHDGAKWLRLFREIHGDKACYSRRTPETVREALRVGEGVAQLMVER